MGEREAFGAVAAHVERAKDALVEALPGPRRPGTPLAEALSAFESVLREARDGMGSWRTDHSEQVWRRCDSALKEAAARAERFRLEAPRLDFEGLALALGDLMAPLDVFAEAERSLG